MALTENLPIDASNKPLLGAVSKSDSTDLVPITANPSTGAISVEQAGVSEPTTTVVRSALILTTSYVAGTVVDTAGTANQLLVLLDFTKGSLDSAEVKVEFSADGTNYYQETFSSISTTTDTVSLGFHQWAASGAYRLAIPIMDRYIKVSVKGTGTVTSSSMTTTLITGTV